jgi:hypothetical protein
VRVVALWSFVLRVRERNGNTTCLFFRCLVDIVDALHGSAVAVAGLIEYVKYSCGKGGLAVVNVADRTYVNVGLGCILKTSAVFCCALV